MSRASKSRDQDVIGTLENIAEEIVSVTGFFHNGDGKMTIPKIQNGVARTNCIDCLDRTNAAQFVIGKRALALQLHALGVIKDPKLGYDTDAVDLFTHMYHDHGDTIAIQYGGSQLVNTMETYRKINQWSSHSRDMVESFRRYYNNSFLDGQRQEAYNLFLGNYRFVRGQPMLWDLSTDYYLHHADPRAWSNKLRRSYTHWYTPSFLETRTLPAYSPPKGEIATKPTSYFDDFWTEYYKPLSVSSLQKIFTYPGKINSTQRYINFRSGQEGSYDLSPFKIRTTLEQEVPKKEKAKKEVTIIDPADQHPETPIDDDDMSVRSTATKRISIQRWLQPIHEDPSSSTPTTTTNPTNIHGIMKESTSESLSTASLLLRKLKLTPLDKSKAAQWTFTQVVHESLNPSVNQDEEEDYKRYIEHPSRLPLVVGGERDRELSDLEREVEGDYEDYVSGRNWGVGVGGGEYGEGPAGGFYGGVGLGGGIGGVYEGNGEEEHEEIEEYRAFLRVAENPLTVMAEDAPKKRYKAYRKWLMGKSLFKQQPID